MGLLSRIRKMAGFNQERSQPLFLQAAEAFSGEARPDARLSGRPAPKFVWLAMAIAAGLALVWIGSAAAYLVGFVGVAGFARLDPLLQALFGAAALLPPVLFVAIAWALGRSVILGHSAEAFLEATDRLFSADETAARTATRLSRTVRRELDALNAGLDGAFARLRALENVLQDQITALDEAGARADVKGQAVAERLTQERERIEGASDALADVATRATETVAGRAAQMKAMIESAEASLRSAGQSLDTQAAAFKAAASAAAEAPHTAAVELDRQAKRIETVSDAALARAEFVLGRQERHRTAMGDLLQRLRDESAGIENNLSQQRVALEHAITALGNQAAQFKSMTGEAGQQLEFMLASSASRVSQLTADYGREAERLKELSTASSAALTELVAALKDSGANAQALISETTGHAKADAKALVGEAMAECEKLLRSAAKLSGEAESMRAIMAKASEDVEKHVLNLPGIAQQEAQRVRQLVRSETEAILDLSARTLSTVHARTTRAQPQRPQTSTEQPDQDPEGLRGLARRLTQRPRKKNPDDKWDMSQLLAAADQGDTTPLRSGEFRSGTAAALGALEAALADMAVDLSAIAGDAAPSDEDWRRYLAGDRTMFARRLASAIDENAVNRITALYRDKPSFRDAANQYIQEFEALLARAREGDGGGLLAPTILSADTGKIYLAVAYALGRLE
jgi:hypothetical protein